MTESLSQWHRRNNSQSYLQAEGSHVDWPEETIFPTGPESGEEGEEAFAAIHRIKDVRLPNDRFVGEAVTLEEMRDAGAV